MDFGIMLGSMWIATIILSITGDVVFCLRMYKDIADCGYRMNINKMNNVLSESDKTNNTESKLKHLIPFFNVYQSLKLMTEYTYKRDEILHQLDIMGMVEEMSDYEKREYEKNPTGLKALFVQGDYREKMENAHKIETDEGSIWYVLDKTTNKIEILKTQGMFSYLSLEEQEAKIIEIKSNQFQKTIESKQQVTDKNRLDKIEDLKKLKKQYTEKSETKEKGYQKINKKNK